MRFRYILHLIDGDTEAVKRHLSARRLEPGDRVAIVGRGEWRVVDVVTSEPNPFNDGIAYCRPVSSDVPPTEVVSA